MKRIAIVTATRAEYGLLTPLIRKIRDDEELDLDLIVTGAHLSDKQGHTIDDIIRDGFPISHEIDILDDDNTPYGISITMANALRGFAECFRDDRPNMVIILGDRTEMLGVASAAMNEQIPIVHIHGGEVTEGAVDDCVRHAITKMSYLHFTSTEEYRRRVIQLGEDPKRVFNVGALGAENILHMKLMSENEIRDDIGIPKDMSYVVVTYHPETLTNRVDSDDISENEDDAKLPIDAQVKVLCDGMERCADLFFVITGANADVGGDRINDLLGTFCDSRLNAVFVQNLGGRRYLSTVKYAAFIMGNSSSGILEAPVLGVPTVNIGDRQKGRIMTDTVINCEMTIQSVMDAMTNAKDIRRVKTEIYGDGLTSYRIIEIIKRILSNNAISLKKGFYDICMQ